MGRAGGRRRAAVRLARILRVTGRSFGALVGLALLTAAGAIFLLSQTVVGRQLAAGFVEDALQGAVKGEVRLGPILGGNLITRALVARFEITTREGTPFLALDSVRIEYNPIGFLTGDYRFRQATVRRARLLLHQDDAGSWNFDRLFEGDGDVGPGRTRILITDVEIGAGELVVRTPWAREATGAERERRIAAGLAGEAVWRVRRSGPDSYERRLELDSLRGRFPLLRLADPVRPMRIELEGVAATARVVARPLEIRRFDGSVVFRDTIEVGVGALRTPSTSLSGGGWIVPDDPPPYRFELAADPIAFEDLAWLPIPVPGTGGGTMDLVIRSSGETVIVEASDGDIRVEDTRLRGGFAVALEETPRFESLDLELRPLRIALVDELLDRERLIDGYLTGRVKGSGPLDLLGIEADLELRDLEEGSRPSSLRADGRISVGEPNEMRGLELELDRFEPRWAALVGIELELGGRARGTATLDGFAGGALSFEADLFHQLPGDSLTHLVGGGVIDLRSGSRVDIGFTADPLSLSLVDPYAKGLDLVGVVRGPFAAHGSLDDLRVTADLRTPRGLLNFDGHFDLEAEEQEYDARLLARDLQLGQWTQGGPETDLAVRGRVRGKGTDPRTLRATFDLEILPSSIEGARVDSSLLRFTLADGLATADTFAIRADVGTVDGFGSFGLTEETSGSLILDISAPALMEWNRWIVAGRGAVRADTSVEGLFADFGREEGEGTAPAERPDTLSGRLAARGVLFGNAKSFAFGGLVNAAEVRYDGLSADSLRFTLDVANPRALDSLVLRGYGWNVQGFGTAADSLFLRLQREGPVRSSVEVYARRDTTVELAARAELALAESRRSLDVHAFRWRVGTQEFRLAQRALLVHGDSGLVIEGVDLVGSEGGRIRLAGAVPEEGMADLDLRIDGLRLDHVARPWRREGTVGGTLDATFRVRGSAGSPRLEGSFAVDEPKYGPLAVPRLRGDVRYADRRLGGRAVVLDDGRELASLEGSFGVDLTLHEVEDRVPPSPLDLAVRADSLPLQPLELAFPSLTAVEGAARGEVRIRGEPGALAYDGTVRIAEGAATLPGLGVRFTDLGGIVRFDGSRATLDSVRFASTAGGRATVAGAVDLASFTNPGLELELSARSFGAIANRLAEAQVDGQGRLSGEYERALLTGTFRISNGEIRVERFLRQRQVVDLSDPEVYALIDTTTAVEGRVLRELQDPFMDNIRLDVTLQMGPALWLRSTELDVEMVGELDLRLDQKTDELSAVGTLRIPRGQYTYTRPELAGLYSRELDVTGGTVAFVGTPGLDPNLDIEAEYRTRTRQVGPLVVTAHIGGTMVRPTLTTSSDPPLPESDRICYLFFASPCVGVGERPAFAASLLREGFFGTVGSQFSQAVGGTGVVDYVNIRTTTGLDGSTLEESPFFTGAEVEIGRYIGEELFVRATQPLGGQLPGASLEWQFSEGWLLEARTEDRYLPLSAFSSSSNINTARTWGLFLFREWEF